MTKITIVLAQVTVEGGRHLKTIGDWSQVIIFLLLLIFAYFFLKGLFKKL